MLGEGECEKTVTITATARDGATSCPGPGYCLEGNCKDGNGGSKSITVRVVKCSCDELEAEVTAGSFDPDPVCVGEETTLQPSISVPEDACICDDGAEYQYSWQFTTYKWIVSSGTWVETPATVNVTGGDTANPTAKFEFPSCGDWFVIARGTVSWLNENCYGRCSAEGSDYAEITVVGVDRVIVAGSITIDDIDGDTGPAQICPEDSISLEAKPCPEFASFPDGQPVWTLESKPAGSMAQDPPDGSATITISDLDKPGNYVFKASCGDSSDSFTVVVKPPQFTLKTLEFTSDHNLMHDGADLITKGVRYPDVEWDPSVPTNAPITHIATDVDKIEVELTLEVECLYDGAAYTLTGTCSEAALNFSKSGTISSGENVKIKVTASSAIGKAIREIAKSISWKINIDGTDYGLGTTGPHTIFTTIGTPNTGLPDGASFPNPSRMDLAVEVTAAAIASLPAADFRCYPGIVWEINKAEGDYFLGTNLGSHVNCWRLRTDGPADCISIARFVEDISRVIGIPGTFDSKTYKAYYRTAADMARPLKSVVGSLSSPHVHPGDLGAVVEPPVAGPATVDPSWYLFLIDSHSMGIGSTKGINNFEAAIEYSNGGATYYIPGGTSKIYDNVDHVVQIFTYLGWAAVEDHDSNPATPDELVLKAIDYDYPPAPVSADPCP